MPKHLSSTSKIQQTCKLKRGNPSATLSTSPSIKVVRSSIDDDDDADAANSFFSDSPGTLADEEKEMRSNEANSAGSTPKGKHKKESCDQTVERQERYHREMMEMQRESLNVFKDVMFKLAEAFTKK